MRKPALKWSAILALALGSPALEAEITITGDYRQTESFWTTGGNSTKNGNVGVNAAGELSLDGGSTVDLKYLYIGSNATGIGTVNVSGVDEVSGAASELTTYLDLNVGNNGTGTLNILAGGLVTAKTYTIIGANVGSDGAVLVDGEGSLLNSQQVIRVGHSGNGVLNILNGGQARTVLSLLVGGNAGSSGSLTVDGIGSLVRAEKGVGIGGSGDGIVTVSNGGEIQSPTEFAIGGSGVNGGTLIVDGGIVETNAIFFLGLGGLGYFNLSNSGRFHAGEAEIGKLAEGIGKLTVKSGAIFSTDKGLSIGVKGGVGYLDVREGGTLDISRDIIGGTIETTSLARSYITLGGTGTNISVGGGFFTGYGSSTVIRSGVTVDVGENFKVEQGGRFAMFVDGSEMINTQGINQDFGFENNGATYLIAGISLAGGNYTPITKPADKESRSSGAIYALGGSYDLTTGSFTASGITTSLSGSESGKRYRVDSDLVVSFAQGIGSVSFAANRINPEVIFGEPVLIAYQFETSLTDTPTGLTFDLGDEWGYDELSFWYSADGSTGWTKYETDMYEIMGTQVTLVVPGFSSYAITPYTAIPEPTPTWLLTGVLLAIMSQHRNRRLSRKAA